MLQALADMETTPASSIATPKTSTTTKDNYNTFIIQISIKIWKGLYQKILIVDSW